MRVCATVPRGAPQHHLQPGLCERGDRHPSALPVSAAGHRGAGRGRQVEGPPRHHRVHAPVGRTAGESWSLGAQMRPFSQYVLTVFLNYFHV